MPQTRPSIPAHQQRSPPATAAVAPDGHGALWVLTRIEGRRLVRHPLFVLGYLVSAIILLAYAGGPPSYEYWNLMGAALLFGGLATWMPLVTFLAAQREQRDHATDLYRATALPARTRTAAALASLLYAATATTALFAVAWLTQIGLDGTITIDRRPVRPGILELAQPPLVVIAFGALGIALGRWLPARGAGPPLILIAAYAASVSALPWVVQRQIEQPSDGLHGHGGWNLAFLTGLTLTATAAAFSREHRSPLMTLVGAIGLTAAIAGLLLGGPYTGAR